MCELPAVPMADATAATSDGAVVASEDEDIGERNGGAESVAE